MLHQKGLNSLPASPSTVALLRGMAADLRELGAAHLDAAKLEFREELSQLKHALIRGAIAAAALGVALLVLTHGLAVLLSDVSGWPLWAGYGVVGALTLAGALSLAWSVRARGVPDTVPTQALERSRQSLERLSQQARSALE